ncbi:MAG: hypothetical protein DHS20C10_05610 [marine bacterium B5-7]|nr:MAG: hypothetical protein DHS20C10_05610 [marine bacterium B5-7]
MTRDAVIPHLMRDLLLATAVIPHLIRDLLLATAVIPHLMRDLHQPLVYFVEAKAKKDVFLQAFLM